MRAQLLTGHGGIDKYSYKTDYPRPVPGPRDILVKVSACGVNNTDLWTREGKYAQDGEGGWQPLSFPRIQGADICGVVESVGTDVGRGPSYGWEPSHAAVGQRVLVYPALLGPQGIVDCRYLGSEVDGGFAEFCVVPADNVVVVPEGCPLTAVELASYPTAYMTALHMVNRARVRPAERVVVTGASGGVGTALVQLCKIRGAVVVAIAGPGKAVAGADVVVTRDDGLVKALAAVGPVDVVLDVVAGDLVMPLLNALRPNGRYASAGAIAEPWVRVHWPTFYLKHLDLLGCMLATPEEFTELVALIASGALPPAVACVFPLAQLGEAQLFFQAKSFTGKIVIDCLN